MQANQFVLQDKIKPQLDGWSDTSENGSKIGERQFRASYKGLDAKLIATTSHKARRAVGLNLILRELKLVDAWLTIITTKTTKYSNGQDVRVENTLDAAVVPALWRASVITYSKAFDRSKGRGANLGIEVVPAPLRLQHRHILDMRNRFIAHSGGILEGGHFHTFSVDHPDDGVQEIVRIDTFQSPIDFPAMEDFASIVHAILEKLPAILATAIESASVARRSEARPGH